MRFLDTYLNKVTMYRLTLYYLFFLIGAAVVLSFFGILKYNPLDILIDTGVALGASYIANKFFAKFVGAVTNSESALITGLILVCIIPLAFPRNILFLGAASVLAMLSKYIATIEKQHVFNPAAVSVLAFSFLSDHIATWWIGTPAMLPFVLVGGLLLARKIQRGKMITAFFLTYFFITGIVAFFQTGFLSVATVWNAGIYHTALFFLGFVMLTEPLTSPPRARLRGYYAALVAILFATPNFNFFGISLAPEMALCIGNIFSYLVSPKYRFVLPLSFKQFFANTGIFAFVPSMPVKFIPGQYMEWTLPHENTDSRGNRRYFSIASSPTEKELLLAVKFYDPSSSYKKRLKELGQKDSIVASSLAGDFVLPKRLNEPIVFIAGGVGIAPFRSMIKYIIDNKLQANIILIYANRTADEIVFQDIFQEAEKYGVKTVYTLTDTKHLPPNWQGEKGYVTEELIKKYVPDFKDTIFYLSGPQLMVERYHALLRSMQIKRSHIKQDFFPGYSET